ncbi:hypothetical protein [Lentisalinibacter salinarum]|uniref:hypothetical protein n=1 Tax=Lentisalinibacter salinarum TaxID=2992239 RepID=UPI00386CE668
MTVISRKHNFIYLKSGKTAGTAIEAHLLTRTVLGTDIWSTAGEIAKYGKPVTHNSLIIGSAGPRLVTAPEVPLLQKYWPWRMRIQEHHHAAPLANLLGSFWNHALKVTSVRNPWDILVSAWQWRRDGRGGNSEPTVATFDEWVRASISSDDEWQRRIQAYDPRRKLMHPFLFIDGDLAVDVLIRQESINEDFEEVAARLNISIPPLTISEKKSNRRRDYRFYYSDNLAELVGDYFVDLIDLCGYGFHP